MLVPAILFKEQITTEFQRIYFTEDMMYRTMESGYISKPRGGEI